MGLYIEQLLVINMAMMSFVVSITLYNTYTVAKTKARVDFVFSKLDTKMRFKE